MRILAYIVAALIGVGLAGHYYPRDNLIQVAGFVGAPALLWGALRLADRARRALVEAMLSGRIRNRLPVQAVRRAEGNGEDISWFVIASGYAGFTPGPTAGSETGGDDHHLSGDNAGHGQHDHHDSGDFGGHDD